MNMFEFKQEHLKKCANIYPKIFNKEPWCDKWTTETAYKRLKDVYDTPNFKGIICIKDENIIGGILGNLENWDTGIKYCLKEFFVDSKIQGLGIGSKMLQYLEDDLKRIGINSMELYTLRGRKTEGFYEKNGYETSKDTIIMTKICI